MTAPADRPAAPRPRKANNPIVRMALWYEESWFSWCWRVWYAGGGAFGSYGMETREEANAELHGFLSKSAALATGGPRAPQRQQEES